MTHNFRPIQPLGDRDVYFITSFNYHDKDLSQDDRMEDPPQDLDSVSSSEKQTTRPTTPKSNDTRKIDESTYAQHTNELEVETTTHRSWNPFKHAGGGGTRLEFQLKWFVIVSCSSYLAYLFI